jgi:hypothetical protein
MADVLDGTPPVVTAPTEPGRRKIVCEFCDCELGADGSYKKMSDKAKKLRDAEETIESLEATISELRSEVTTLKAQIPAPVTHPATEGTRRGMTF